MSDDFEQDNVRTRTGLIALGITLGLFAVVLCLVFAASRKNAGASGLTGRGTTSPADEGESYEEQMLKTKIDIELAKGEFYQAEIYGLQRKALREARERSWPFSSHATRAGAIGVALGILVAALAMGAFLLLRRGSH